MYILSVQHDCLIYTYWEMIITVFSSVQFSCSVASDSLQLHGLQHARPPCPLTIPGVYSNSWPLGRWCHPTISASVIPFSSYLQSFPASKSFQMSSSNQVAKVLQFSFNISPSNEHLGLVSLRMDWLDLLAVQRTIKSLLQYHSSKASILRCSAFIMVFHTWLLEKPWLWQDGPGYSSFFFSISQLSHPI